MIRLLFLALSTLLFAIQGCCLCTAAPAPLPRRAAGGATGLLGAWQSDYVVMHLYRDGHCCRARVGEGVSVCGVWSHDGSRVWVKMDGWQRGEWYTLAIAGDRQYLHDAHGWRYERVGE